MTPHNSNGNGINSACSRSSSSAIALITAFTIRIVLIFKPTAIANLMAVALVAAASHVKNGSKKTQHIDTLKSLILQEL